MQDFRYVVIKDFLNQSLVNNLINNPPGEIEEGALLPAAHINKPEGNTDNNIRKQKVGWYHEQADVQYQWLFDKIKLTASQQCPIQINSSKLYSIQYGIYGPDNYYKMHTDSDGLGIHPDNHRVLSATILLQSADKGGEFELKDYGIIPMEPGDAIFFDSTMLHQVRPVTKGVRKSLVIWLDAPPERIKQLPPTAAGQVHTITLPEFDREGLIRYIDEHAKDERDDDCKNMVGCYKPPIAEQLLRDMLPTVKHALDIDDLWVCNTYARIYEHGSILKTHTDRDGLDYVITITLRRDHPWTINVGGMDIDDNDERIGYLFEAINIPHDRLNPYRGNKCYQLFMHYTRNQKYEFDNKSGHDENEKVDNVDDCENPFDTLVVYNYVFNEEQAKFLRDQYDDDKATYSTDFWACRTMSADKIEWREDICAQIKKMVEKTATTYNMDSYVCLPQIVKWPKDYPGFKLHSDYGESNEFPWREFCFHIALNDVSDSGVIEIPKINREIELGTGCGVIFKGGVLPYDIIPALTAQDDCYRLVMWLAPKFNWNDTRPDWPSDNFIQAYEQSDVESPYLVKSTEDSIKQIDNYIIECDFPVREFIEPRAQYMIEEFIPDYEIDQSERNGYNRPYEHYPFRLRLAEKFVETARMVFSNVTDDIYEEDGYLTTKYRRITPYTYIQNNIHNGPDWHHHIRTSTINAVMYYDIPKVGGEIEFFTEWYHDYVKFTPQENKIYFFPYYLYHHPCPQEDEHWRINVNLEILQLERPLIRDTNIMW